MKFKMTYLIFVIIVGLISLGVYSTYAMFTTTIDSGNFVTIKAAQSYETKVERIVINPGESNYIDLNINNDSGKLLTYQVWYEMLESSIKSSDVFIGTLHNTTTSNGALPPQNEVTVNMLIENNSNDPIIIRLGVAYSQNSSVNLSTGKSAVTEVEAEPEPLPEVPEIPVTPIFDISDDSVLITKGSSTSTLYVYGGNNVDPIEIGNTDVVEIYGSTNTNKITVDNCSANILLTNITINSSSAFVLNGSASVNLQINGTNNLTSSTTSGILVPSTASLTISQQGSGTLNVTGETGIGSNGSKAGTITINSGTIKAEATGLGGAGIGGADLVSITINGGNITATGSGGGNAIDRSYGGGAGIGTVGGSDIGGNVFTTSLTGSIRINGGTIVATGADYAAAIGAGSGANDIQTASNVYISSSANVTLYHSIAGTIEEGWTGNSA